MVESLNDHSITECQNTVSDWEETIWATSLTSKLLGGCQLHEKSFSEVCFQSDGKKFFNTGYVASNRYIKSSESECCV